MLTSVEHVSVCLWVREFARVFVFFYDILDNKVQYLTHVLLKAVTIATYYYLLGNVNKKQCRICNSCLMVGNRACVLCGSLNKINEMMTLFRVK